MKKRFLKYSLIGLLFFILGCTRPSADAQFRIAQLLVTNSPVTIKMVKDGAPAFTDQLSYGTLGNYEKIAAGKYRIQIFRDKQLILDKKIGLAHNGKYSIYLYGLPIENKSNNASTLENTLHTIAEGEEANDTNDYLPKLKILNDIFYGDTTKAKIRWIHTAPGVEKLKGHLLSTATKDSNIVNTLDYPKQSKYYPVIPGEHEIFWSLGSEERIVARANVTLQPKTIYTFFIVPQRMQFIDSLQVLTAITTAHKPN
ncbi:MAG TPA: DUF4397 domain-containing protein [Leeuwenhoekiella sp.]|nr:DUF4397 domain-containing protein [Leeuwenhoekiella sp.]